MENLRVALDKISVDGSATKGLESNGSDADNRRRRSFSIICVEGYDTSIQRYVLMLELTKHFAPCGHVVHVYVPRDFERGIVKRYSFLWIAGEAAGELALHLDGSDVGGWKVFVTPAPLQVEESDSELAERFFRGCSKQLDMMYVTGFDTSRPKIDIQIALAKHFSSCGVINDVFVNMSRASIIFWGEGAVDKALALNNACDSVGGWKIVVTKYPPSSKRKTTGYLPSKQAYKKMTMGVES